jgi:hypothetical protein
LENGQLEMPEIEHEDQSFVDEELDQLDLAEDDDN